MSVLLAAAGIILAAAADFSGGKANCPEPSVMPTADMVLPRVMTKVEPNWPTYPSGIRKLSAKVILVGIVDLDGNVAEEKAISCKVSKGGKTLEGEQAAKFCPQFSFAAEAAYSRWRYRPALRNGAPVCVEYTARIDFISK